MFYLFVRSILKKILPILIILVSILSIHFFGHGNIVIYLIFPPVVLGLGTWYILEHAKWKLNIISLTISVLVVINDFLLRIFGGGIYDLEGNFLVLLVSGGALFTVTALIIGNGIIKKTIKQTFISLIVPALLISFYLVLFGTLGVIKEKLPSKSIEESRNEDLLVSELNFSERKIISQSNTLYLKEGWVENILRIEDKGFRFDSTRLKRLKVLIKFEGNFDQYYYDDSISYKIDLPNYNGRSIMRSTIHFTIDSLIDTIPIIFYNTNNDKEIIKIEAITNTGL